MLVGVLKDLIKDLDDGVEIVVPGGDHSYRGASAIVTTALSRRDNSGYMTEDYGEDITPEEEYGKRVPVVRVS